MANKTITVETANIRPFVRELKGKKLKVDITFDDRGIQTGYIEVTRAALIEFIAIKKIKSFRADIWDNSVYVDDFKL